MSAITQGLDFTDEFQTALSAIERCKNLFVTGKAGTGKSTLLRSLREISKLNIAITAPTGLAAVNVGGQTIHSFFRFPPRLINTDDIKASRQSAIYKKLDVLVIDEVSMVRADLMSGIDHALRLNRDAPNKPFGGVCVVMFGDLHQLPPIVADAEIQRYLTHKYKGIYFFNSSAFSRKYFSSLELTKKFRQTDPVFSSLLDCVADRTISDYQLDALNGLVTKFDNLREHDKFVIQALEEYAPRGAIRISKSALQFARDFYDTVVGKYPRDTWIMCFEWATSQSAQYEQNGPWIDVGPGLMLGANKRHEVPAGAVFVIDGMECVIHVPKGVWQNAAERLIDFDEKAFGKLVLR